ncbi:MAG: caspase family protein, partial [Caldilineaceae bacterium]|nr:caspase family protein [Caldilineaceae bacterium]
MPTPFLDIGPIRKRYALLVGADAYVDPALPKLDHCVNDVKLLQAELEQLSYHVVALHDDASSHLLPTLDNVREELTKLVDRLEPADLLWVHFSCHGRLEGDEAVLFLNNTRMRTCRESGLPVDQELKNFLRMVEVHRVVLTLDACQMGLATERGIEDPAFVARVYEQAEGFALLVAGSGRQAAYEWEEKEQGVFTHFLAEGIRGAAELPGQSFITVESLFNYVVDGVRTWSSESGLAQTPRKRVDGTGDLIVADRRGSSNPAAVAHLSVYLAEMEAACATVRLPYAAGEATIPLEEIYVALRADRSSPAERQASALLFQRLVEEQRALGFAYEVALQRARAQDPYTARYLEHDPDLRQQLQNFARNEERTLQLAEVVRGHRWLVLLGHPGSGKSTMARWLALELAQAMAHPDRPVTIAARQVDPGAEEDAPIEALGPARLPILVRLADYAAARWREGKDTQLALADFLGAKLPDRAPQREHALAFNQIARTFLDVGQAVIILDGLDEVTDLNQRQVLAGEIETLMREHVKGAGDLLPLTAVGQCDDPTVIEGGNQLIVTSRIVGYQVRPLHKNVPHFVLQDMDETAVRRFCANWAAAPGHDLDGDKLAVAVLEHSNPHVRTQMGRNPLLLTILAQIYTVSPVRRLPARRAQLYGQAKDAVFNLRRDAWQAAMGETPPADFVNGLERLTGQVAFSLHANPDYPASLADGSTIKEWLVDGLGKEPALIKDRRPEDVADSLLTAAANLSGFFVARGEDAYGFLHRQFQEYFAALAMKQTLNAAQRSDSNDWQVVDERLYNANWREPLLLLAGVLSRAKSSKLIEHVLDAADPADAVLPHNLFWAAAALYELERPPAALTERVAQGLLALYRRDDPRFDFLHARTQSAFARLRTLGNGNGPDRVLATALLAPETSLRTAALELMIRLQWYTPSTVRSLVAAWSGFAEPAALMLLAFDLAYAAEPDHFVSVSLPLRSRLEAEPDLWQIWMDRPHWRQVIRVLYLAPGAEDEPQAIVRDSPLTAELTALSLSEPDNVDSLFALLQRAHIQTEAAARDGWLAGLLLGDPELLTTATIIGARQSVPAQAGLAAGLQYLARDLDL